MDTILHYAWLIPLFPLFAFIVLVSFGRQLRGGASSVGILAAALSCVLALVIGWQSYQGAASEKVLVEWMNIRDTVIRVGYEINSLNAMMLVIISVVSLLVQIYSKEYMRDDERVPVYYQYLSLFAFSMMALVLSPNLLQLYIFWELVGVCSFLLIGYHFSKPKAMLAAKKAFIVTRIGDVGLLIAIILLFWWTGSFEYSEIFKTVALGKMEPWMTTLTAVLIFVGAVGKSGQFPLHTWLPDAMEGPTPVSALIHAATMVAAGVYLVAATYPLFLDSQTALDIVAYTGGFTAIFAALIGLTQTDIKRVLAYSTISQLGYMMLALGVAGAIGYTAGVFHLFTHAFFKALLFLAAGSVIHAVHTQDLFQMGGLLKKMPVTGIAFLIGCLAIAGIPPFSGYWSKEEIISAVYSAQRADLLWIAVITVFLTSFYMFRLFFLTFTGKAVSQAISRAKDPSAVMRIPLLVLAVLAVLSGFLNMPFAPLLENWQLAGDVGESIHFAMPEAAELHAPWLSVVSVLVSLAGIVLAYLIYVKKAIAATWIARPLPWLYRLSNRAFYLDEIYRYGLAVPLRGIGMLLDLFDHYLIGGLVQLAVKLANGLGGLHARLQSGQMQTYGLIVLLGIVLLLIGITTQGGVSFGQ